MATPVAHSLAGLAVATSAGPTSTWQHRRASLYVYGVAVISANAADLDFVPGLLIGDAVRFHHGLSHSISFVALWTVAVWLLAKATSAPTILLVSVAGISYATHLLLDAATGDRRAPYGIPLFAPFSDGHWSFSWTPFRAVTHGNPGDSAAVVLNNVISMENAWTMVLESLYLAPVLAVCWWLGRVART